MEILRILTIFTAYSDIEDDMQSRSDIAYATISGKIKICSDLFWKNTHARLHIQAHVDEISQIVTFSQKFDLDIYF